MFVKRVTIRLDNQVHAFLSSELVEWRKVRGPKFSLNDLCSEKLSQPLQITTWPSIMTGTNSSNPMTTVPAVTVYSTYSTPVTTQKEKKCQEKKWQKKRSKKR